MLRSLLGHHLGYILRYIYVYRNGFFENHRHQQEGVGQVYGFPIKRIKGNTELTGMDLISSNLLGIN